MQWNTNSALANVETEGHIYWCFTLLFSELVLSHDISVLYLIKTNKGSFNVVTSLFGKKNKKKRTTQPI